MTTGNNAAEPVAATSAIAYAISFVAFAWAAWPALMPIVKPALRVDPAE